MVDENDIDDAGQRVRVAILDISVHAKHPSIKTEIERKRIRDWKGFPETFDPLLDQSGHGTHVASVLLRTAPRAILYIARVADDCEKLKAVGDYRAAANVRVCS